ncbi:hypothetical protein [Actinoplanes sp. NPDC048796]|uniref:hypothetical protein n=1 Tax=Actinoplanes sp. NPDC048796 TaxID=3155640 RepID=UPI0033BFFBAB
MSTSTKATFSAVTSGLIAFLSALLTALQGENTGFDTILLGLLLAAVQVPLYRLAEGYVGWHPRPACSRSWPRNERSARNS